MNMRYAALHDGESNGSGGCGLYDISMVDRMMMKFRPIARTSWSGSGESTTDKGVIIGRGKKRYVRVKCNNNNKNTKKRKVSTLASTSLETVSGDGDKVVTLSLMPETPSDKLVSFKNQTSRDSQVTIGCMEEDGVVCDGGNGDGDQCELWWVRRMDGDGDGHVSNICIGWWRHGRLRR